MPTLAQKIASRAVRQGSIVAWWLGGSGFVFKIPVANGSHVTLCVDPYLSNSAQAIFGVGRGFPSPISPEELDVDFVIATHTHEDHLDPGAIPQIAAAHPRTRLIAPPAAGARAMGWGVHRDRISLFSAGSSVEHLGVKISHAPARHDARVPGWETPDAMGVIIEAPSAPGSPGLSIYQSGDTEYDIRIRLLRDRKPDVAILCINGAGGNMDAHEAALLAWQIKSSTVIPMHHILWDRLLGPETPTLDPQLLVDTYRKLGGKGNVVLPVIGEEIELSRP